MTVNNLIQTCLSAGKTVLTEDQAKEILAQHGVPVIDETVVATPSEAVSAAEKYGYPSVVKALGENYLHKTEKGLVQLNLMDAFAVEKAALRIREAAPGARLLVQRQVQGKREFVAGLFRDPHFGPAILFGLGGVYTEAIADVAVRLAPLTPQDADDLIDSIRARSFLGDFRGERAVDRQALLNVLMGLSTLATDYPAIAEIDVNPLIALANGSLKAVDALITLAEPKDRSVEPQTISPAIIHGLFYPRSVAFIGASAQMGKWGHTLICNTIKGGYRGDIYPVNPKGGVIAGRPVFRRLADIPAAVDLAVVTLPAKAILALLPQLADKGIQHVLLITSGFGETGPEGERREQQLVTAARKAGIVVLGPNTMGICNPHIALYCLGVAVLPMAGSTAVVAQSGNMGTQLLAFAEAQGIGIRAFCGSGNEAMITIEDYLDGFEVDDRTRTVLLYVESVKNGRRFFESARRVSPKKPIVLLKGGQTRAGRRAASSHTGALATDSRLFEAVCRQAGIIKVDQPMELLDLSAGFASLPLPKGNRVAIMTLGGGWGVVTADLCDQHGLEVPTLSETLVAAIDRILPPYWSRSNPVDLVGEADLSIPLPVMESLLAWEGCDAVINLGIYGRRHFLARLALSVKAADPSYSEQSLDATVQHYATYENNYIKEVVRLMQAYDKPVYGVSILTEKEDATVHRVGGSDLKAVFYETPERAVKTAARMVEYQRFCERQARG